MFLFAMAGLSNRFRIAGYDKPKFSLEAHGASMFEHSVVGFSKYFGTEDFLFVTLRCYDAGEFIRSRSKRIGIPPKRVRIVELDATTTGQAETVMLGLLHGGIRAEEPLTIFNIDTFRPGFSYPNDLDLSRIDGYLETFVGLGDHWSFVKPLADGDPERRVAEVAEKRRISPYCSSGLYHFRATELFLRAYGCIETRDPAELQGGERYVAPLYNCLIAEGYDIRFAPIEKFEIIHCGTPVEYRAVLDLETIATLRQMPPS
ncbi:hypothetical protein [Methylosinus sp. LW3]|uniref:hypothetical protein n=1 Tax=Methylosinus sp. LW3 TaxID=107635 RepID=UPI0009FC8F6C|nr:hypothetical protein [Methylosinus sp. LW3]